MTNVFSWQNSVSLCPASFCTPRPNFPVTPGISWFPTLTFHPRRWKGICVCVCVCEWVLEGHAGLQRTGRPQLHCPQWLGHRLGLLWCWMVCLSKEPILSVIFDTAPRYCILDSFVDCESYFISSKGFFPTVVDKMVIWIKFTHSSTFLVYWFLKCQCSLLPSPVWPRPVYPGSWT